MSKLYIFGGDYSSDFNETYGLYEDWKGGLLPKAWTKILAEKIEYELIDFAKEGVSNYTIFSQFIDVCTEVRSGDILILGWTNLNKTRVANNENEFIELNSRNVIEDSEMSPQTINEINKNREYSVWASEVHGWMKFIIEFCLRNDVEVYNWTSEKKIFKDVKKFIDFKEYLMVKDINYLEKNIIEFITSPIYNNKTIPKSTITQETFGDIIDYRLGEFGHINLANFMYEYITFFTGMKKIHSITNKNKKLI